jgi:hypothetical protein
LYFTIPITIPHPLPAVSVNAHGKMVLCSNQFELPKIEMRKQYFFRESSEGLLAWDVDRLVELSRHLPRKRVPLREIRELDQHCFDEEKRPTWRDMLEHMKLVDEADLSFPIILSATGEVMDGRHRILKAALQGRLDIDVLQFERDPEPDYIGADPNDLPY